MDALTLDDLPRDALLLVDTAPIVYVLDGGSSFTARFRPVFDAQAEGRCRLAVSTLAIAEVLAGPLKAGNDALARRYRGVLESWRVVDLTPDIAESAARFRARLGLKLPDAVQLASALAIGADALVTHDRDFRRVTALRVIS